MIHLLPIPVVLRSKALERLYGIRFQKAVAANSNGDDDDDHFTENLEIAMQHRAVLFGSLGTGLWIRSFLHRSSVPMAIPLV